MDNKKKRAILGILRTMHLNGITINDLVCEKSSNPEFLPHKFDLLCLVHGVPKRMSFDEGRNLHPIALFPFATGNWYLELAQDDNMLRCNVDEKRLPDRDIWLELYKLKDDLNAQLLVMDQPPLSGSYFAHGGNLNWIVRFDEEKTSMPENYYDPETVANIRYCGSLDAPDVV